MKTLKVAMLGFGNAGSAAAEMLRDAITIASWKVDVS